MITGNFASGRKPPSRTDGKFTFAVEARSTKPQNYDIDAIVGNSQRQDVITPLTAQFIGKSGVVLEYDIRSTEVELPDGQYTLKVVAEPTFGGKRKVLASQSITIGEKLAGNGGGSSGSGNSNGGNGATAPAGGNGATAPAGGNGGQPPDGTGQTISLPSTKKLAVLGAGAVAAAWFVGRN